MKKRYLFVLLPLAFAYGMLSAQLKIFPYEQLRQIKHLISMRDVLANRYVDTAGKVPLASVATYPERLVFLTYGQSNAANTGQLGYEVRQPVFMVSDGVAYEYSDPSLGTTGPNGSVWGRVGDKLIEQGAAKAVFFINVAWGGASMEELVRDHPFDYLENQLRQGLDQFGRIDGILIHHGERHNKNIPDKTPMGAETYPEPFMEFRGKLAQLTDAPIYLSLVSYCGDRGIDEELLKVQDGLIRDLEGVLRGVNSDALVDVKYRLPDQCHFSAAGLDAMADDWVSAILAKSED
ncbi:hypothetical protein [Marimonas lutisalis]|uniref:hypothetical protein n=1 Tax=Marimonas lutisalis TaxID=2545756 RepID=UPI0010F58B79|nr:hypothetical protein [Marimonas lutisalis]